jgi:glycosidase
LSRENGPFFHFHISKAARERYRFGRELFATSGNVIFVDLHAVRMFARRINESRRAKGDPRALRAGDMNAMGLIDEVLHYVSRLYAVRTDQRIFGRALAFLDERVGAEAVDRLLIRFLSEFPPREVFEGSVSVERHLKEHTGETSNREIALEELLHLRLANANPAFEPFTELFDQEPLAQLPDYDGILRALGDFFAAQPAFGPDNQDLVSMLQAPAIAAPRSLMGQLDYIRTRWGYLLGDLLLKLLMGIDLIKEEEKLRFAFFQPGPPEVYEYAGQLTEPEAFSADKDWMPKVVMIAKNALVWLDQLSRRHGRAITRLDQIPDEELDRLARWGITALWLIGVWERSGASRRIKRLMGNPEAEASAYSLFDYVVAEELGGEEALRNLKDRAWRRGIRLGSDMVPNHTGIDSRWMIEHPDRFLTYPRPHPPFPSYSFGGENLAIDSRVGVFLEDHYYSKSDAAVVFKRVDFHTGDSRYIYHGNDGTHMPWNDTSQLNFLNPETRQAVIDTIVHVASHFPIIRFDAAMTLTKRHFQRLWFPEPGRGGDIPSRAECGMSRFDFDHAMPNEFWREVVDRIAAEAPDTLLLAEAFWLLEGFFVRTLGMHRVYNSAFMNMLKVEDNASYRQTIKNTLEFEPEVLKRFVNFMSNPDEETAVAQFGDGDKYFGVCILMATMPGLPMFAHGQIEGFREKYGMEFRRAYWNEIPNQGFIERHEREIFPLLARRRIFCGVEGFLLYDLFDAGGWVNEDVFAYSNRRGSERALVLYNNRFRDAQGWIKISVAFSEKTAAGKSLVQRTLGEGLALSGAEGAFVVFREHPSGLEYIRRCRDIWERGMFVELKAYGCQVFLDFREVSDDGRWSRLWEELAGRGVPSIDAAMREMDLRPVLQPFRRLVSAAVCRALLQAAREGATRGTPGAPKKGADGTPGDGTGTLFSELCGAHALFVAGAKERAGSVDTDNAIGEFRRLCAAAMSLDPSVSQASFPVLWAWAVVRPLCGGPTEVPASDAAEKPASCPAISWLDEWMLSETVRGCCVEMGWAAEAASRSGALLAALLEYREGFSAGAMVQYLANAGVESYLGVNLFDGTRWFHKESLEALLEALVAVRALQREAAEGAAVAGDQSSSFGVRPSKPAASGAAARAALRAAVKKDRAFAGTCLAEAEKSGYMWDVFLKALRGGPAMGGKSAGGGGRAGTGAPAARKGGKSARGKPKAQASKDTRPKPPAAKTRKPPAGRSGRRLKD